MRLAALALLIVGVEALAYPNGAPWGAAQPTNPESCSSCHYDFEPIADSDQVLIDGLPERIKPGEPFTLRLTLTDRHARTSGFQLLVSSADDIAIDCDRERVECIVNGARSTATQLLRDDKAVWELTLTPTGSGPATLTIAASAANDDQSPFGDRIHYREVRLGDD